MPHKEINGIPSVTTILSILAKPALYRWYAENGWEKCEQIKRESSAFGSSIHDHVATFLKTKEVNHELVNKFSAKYLEEPFDIVEVEPDEPYISHLYNYQGTFDWLDKNEDGLRINDLKVTNRFYPEGGLQLAAYAWLYCENHDLEMEKVLNRGVIWRIDKKTQKVYTKHYQPLTRYFDVFKSLILPYEYLHGSNRWA